MPAVLFVDDEPMIRRVVELWLRRHGVTLRPANGIAEAIEVLAAEHVDGVFIDAWLEDGSGLDLYDWIRAERPALARSVAFITGDAASPALVRRMEATGCPVLGKPFDLDRVKEIAAGWARGGGAEAARDEARGRS